jgi:uncharacterized protein (DUF1684 family)
MRNCLAWAALCFPIVAFAQPYDEVSVREFQNGLTAHYADSLKSPLRKEDLKSFKGLEYFAPDPKYFVIARFKRAEEERPFKMKTSTGRLPLYIKYGELRFTLDGRQLKLIVYQNVDLAKRPGFEKRLFLPFSDLTNGRETYIGGRYVDVEIPDGDTMAVDFNKAYNPYCAYNHDYSCPIVPLENDLPVEIRAGVKNFHD